MSAPPRPGELDRVKRQASQSSLATHQRHQDRHHGTAVTAAATNDERLSTLIIEAEDGRLERRVCDRHLWAIAAITEQLTGLAYRLVPYQWSSAHAPA
jgi:hypothetical protein